MFDLVIDCDKVFAMLPQVKWSEPVFAIASQLLEKCVMLLSENFVEVLLSESFSQLGKVILFQQPCN